MSATAPIIFLDIDGVLCTANTSNHDVYDIQDQLIPRQRAGHSTFDPIAIAYLNRLCETTGARVVVSSSWRNDDDVPHILRRVGFAGTFHPDWRTPYIKGGHSYRARRGREIAAWLLNHPDITRYVIIDDDGDMLPEQRAHFVQTSGWYGFGLLEMEAAKDLLGVTPLLNADQRAAAYRANATTLRRLANRQAPKKP